MAGKGGTEEFQEEKKEFSPKVDKAARGFEPGTVGPTNIYSKPTKVGLKDEKTVELCLKYAPGRE